MYISGIITIPKQSECNVNSYNKDTVAFCLRAKLLLDQSDSWHSDLPCYQTNMAIGHKLILPSSVFLGRTSCLITHSVWSFDYHFQSTAVLASFQIGRVLLLLLLSLLSQEL